MTFHFDVLTPSDTFFSGEVTCVTLPLADGSMQFLARHAEELTTVVAGDVRLDTPDGQSIIRTAGGVFYCDGAQCTLFSQQVAYPADWDEQCDARAAYLSGEQQRRRQSMQEHHLSTVALNKAFVQMNHPLREDRND